MLVHLREGKRLPYQHYSSQGPLSFLILDLILKLHHSVRLYLCVRESRLAVKGKCCKDDSKKDSHSSWCVVHCFTGLSMKQYLCNTQ